MFLHAWEIALPHPGSGEPLVVRCPLPADLRAFLSALPDADPDEVETWIATAP